ncbi:MAG: hypothetical protein AAFV53_35150 [Myxococcota bacterium]
MSLTTAFALLGLSSAFAQDPPDDPPDDPSDAAADPQAEPAAEETAKDQEKTRQTDDITLLLGVRGVGEIWQDPALITAHRSSYFAGAGMVSWRFSSWLSADVELSYLRMGTTAGNTHEMSPIAIDICARKIVERMEMFAGLGPALVPFSSFGQEATAGVKLGVDMRAGVRIATNFYNPPKYPKPAFSRMDLELMVGRRQHMRTPDAILNLQQALQQKPEIPENGDGHLDLSAVRVGVGVVIRR